MRRILCLASACAVAASLGTAPARAGDRYGAQTTAPQAAALDREMAAEPYAGPLLGWTAKTPVIAEASVTSSGPAPLSDWARRAQGVSAVQVQPVGPPVRAWLSAPTPSPVASTPLPTSLYDPPAPAAAPRPVAVWTPAPEPLPMPPPVPVNALASMQVAALPYQPARPTGEVIQITTADFSGPSLERQQAAEEDAAMMAAKIARADAAAAKPGANGKSNDTTVLLGGP